MMRRAGVRTPGLRTRALVVVLWRAGLRINEAMSLNESDLDPAGGSILIRRGKVLAAVSRGGLVRLAEQLGDELGWLLAASSGQALQPSSVLTLDTDHDADLRVRIAAMHLHEAQIDCR